MGYSVSLKPVSLDFILKLKEGPFFLEWETNELAHACSVSDEGRVDHIYKRIGDDFFWRHGTITTIKQIFSAVSKKNAGVFMFKCKKK